MLLAPTTLLAHSVEAMKSVPCVRCLHGPAMAESAWSLFLSSARRGAGKTTLLRDIARVLADLCARRAHADPCSCMKPKASGLGQGFGAAHLLRACRRRFHKRVVIGDTSNEIAGALAGVGPLQAPAFFPRPAHGNRALGMPRLARCQCRAGMQARGGCRTPAWATPAGSPCPIAPSSGGSSPRRSRTTPRRHAPLAFLRHRPARGLPGLHAGLRGSLDAELPPAAWRLHARDEIHGARQVVVVDEIGNAKEAAAVKGSAQRGVVFIGTAHGVALGNLVANPELNSLVGGTQAVILSDVEARRAPPPPKLLHWPAAAGSRMVRWCCYGARMQGCCATGRACCRCLRRRRLACLCDSLFHMDVERVRLGASLTCFTPRHTRPGNLPPKVCMSFHRLLAITSCTCRAAAELSMRARGRASNAGVKTRTERRGAPPFRTLVEARACLPRPAQRLLGPAPDTPAPGRYLHIYYVHAAAAEMTVSRV